MSTLLMHVGYAAMRYAMDARADGTLFETEPFTQRVGPLAGRHQAGRHERTTILGRRGDRIELRGDQVGRDPRRVRRRWRLHSVHQRAHRLTDRDHRYADPGHLLREVSWRAHPHLRAKCPQLHR